VQDPRVVVVPRSHVVRNMLAIQERSLISAEDDLLLSWLPLFHDMGLLGFMVLPMITGTALALASPEAFLARPSMWMEAVGSFRASITGAPCFAYGVAARSLGGSVDLSPLRLAFNGAEPIDPATVEQFTTTAQPAALDPRAMYCVYGLAEATLAVTLPEPGVGMHVDHLDATALERDGVAVPADASTDQTRLLARLGTPIRHCEVRIADPSDGRVLGGGAAGEVQLRGGSVTPGYYRDDAGSTAAMVDGWFRTGDIGYWADDELVICGRIKEIIIVGGRNIFPEHVEREVECIKGVRLGNSVAFSIEDGRGREGIAVVAEVSARATDTAALRTLIVERVRAVVDVPPADVLLVAPGQLPKTPSGKRQRAACRTQYLEGRFEPA
jgi:fatty-acyl-CoA synthase